VVTTDVRSAAILTKAQALADDVNMLSSPTANRGDAHQADVAGKLDSGTGCSNGTLSSAVGAGYNAVVDRYYTNYRWTCSAQYKSSKGYDATLAALTDRNLKWGTTLYGQMLYGMYQDAQAMTGGCTLDNPTNNNVKISEIYYQPNPSASPSPTWVEICNQGTSNVDLSGHLNKSTAALDKGWTLVEGTQTAYVFKEGTMLLAGKCILVGKDGGNFAADHAALSKDALVCSAANMVSTGSPPQYWEGSCSGYQTIDEAYDSFYTPHGSKFPTLGTSGHLYLKYFDGASTTTIDDVAWGGTGQPVASQGKSIARLYGGATFTDTGSSADWLSNQTPTPRGFLSPTVVAP
jgi:hypothetical protein